MNRKGLSKYPELLENYARHAKLKAVATAEKRLDISSSPRLRPTTLLPLADFMQSQKGSIVVVPKNAEAARYIERMASDAPETISRADVLLSKLPKDRNDSAAILRQLYKLYYQNSKKKEDPLIYVAAELMDNIYQHSKSTNALVMAQLYPEKKFLEACFFDNGVSIPANMEAHGLTFETDFEAINHAIRGLSTKPEEGRGRGLGNSLKIITEGMKGEALVVSRRGAISINSRGVSGYILQGPYFELRGTLVAARIPFPPEDVNVYAYID